MKTLLKKIVVAILTFEARVLISRHKPLVIAITGSVGKTSTKEAIAAVVARRYSVRKSAKSFNSEFGVPLTVLDEDTAWGSASGWAGIIARGFFKAFFSRDYPEALIIEAGVDGPGDMARLVSWMKFDGAVITHIGSTPVHVEAFPSVKALVAEKMKILKGLKPQGFAVLAHDDEKVMQYKDSIKQRVFTFGFEEGATVKGGYYNIDYDAYGVPKGIVAKILIGSNAFPLALRGVLGKHFVYPALAATAVGNELDINMVEILSALEGMKPVPGRMRLFEGINSSFILDDTYNASPVAVREALATLADLRVRGKRIAILGDMRELGELSRDAHREIGALAAEKLDALAVVGVEAREIAFGAQEAGMTHVRQFDVPADALAWAKKDIESGDAVLVKASQFIRLERVVAGLLADERDRKHLVRQDAEWEVR